MAVDYDRAVLDFEDAFHEPPGYGCGQGNGGGPTFWVLNSSPMLQILHEESYGTNFKGAISGTRINFVVYTFIDNTDLMETAKNEWENIHHIVYQM